MTEFNGVLWGFRLDWALRPDECFVFGGRFGFDLYDLCGFIQLKLKHESDVNELMNVDIFPPNNWQEVPHGDASVHHFPKTKNVWTNSQPITPNPSPNLLQKHSGKITLNLNLFAQVAVQDHSRPSPFLISASSATWEFSKRSDGGFGKKHICFTKKQQKQNP